MAEAWIGMLVVVMVLISVLKHNVNQNRAELARLHRNDKKNNLLIYALKKKISKLEKKRYEEEKTKGENQVC